MRTLTVIALSLALAACGYFGGHSSARPAGAAHAHGPPAPDAATIALAGMIDAVGPGRGRAPVTLKFAIRSRPEVGKVDEIDFALVPHTEVDSLRIVLGARDGLEMVSGGQSRVFARPVSGVPLFGTIEVRPDQPGIFTVTAAVGIDSSNQTVVWPYTIPLIAGEGPPQSAGSGAAAPPHPAVAAVSP